MSSSYIFEFLNSWSLTLIVELSVLLLLTRKKALSLRIFAGLLASSTTLPYLWFVLPQFIHHYSLFLITGEGSIVLIEAVIYFFLLNLTPKKAAFISFTCNLMSFLFGLLMQNLLH